MISFSRTDEKHSREYITHLVQSAYYDTERDIVQLQADPRLFELYQFDRKVVTGSFKPSGVFPPAPQK